MLNRMTRAHTDLIVFIESRSRHVTRTQTGMIVAGANRWQLTMIILELKPSLCHRKIYALGCSEIEKDQAAHLCLRYDTTCLRRRHAALIDFELVVIVT